MANMMRGPRALGLLFAVIWMLIGPVTAYRLGDDPPWQTEKHEPGYCAMYDICGHRADGDTLNCASNTRSAPPSGELALTLQAACPTLWNEMGGMNGTYCCTPKQVEVLQASTQRALPFIVGCPACQHNFVHLWCVLTCSPDQATFTNITAVQLAADNNATVVKEVAVWLDPGLSSALFDSCKDVKFGAANLPAINFIGGGARSAQAWLDFLGEVKDKRVPPVGSPFQIDFNPNRTDGAPGPPDGISPARGALPSCGDAAFTCSCADCPVAPGCAMPPPGPAPGARGCRAGAVSCWDLTLILTYIGLLAAVAGSFLYRRKLRELRDREALLFGPTEPLLAAIQEGDALPLSSAGGGGAPFGGGGGEEEDDTEPPPGDAHYPWLERWLQIAYRAHGELCARKPLHVIGAGALLVAFCLLGLLRFRLETDPLQLWVGRGSQAARDKAAYEASFGPFYRVAQLILTTTPSAASNFTSPGGLPSIVTAGNIRLLFEMQAEVDAISAPYAGPDGRAAPGNASLASVCFKPFGSACATQSVLQYWRMDRDFYEKEMAKGPYSSTRLTPEFCFGHWYTQCRSAFEAPMDPHVVLGGFPVGPEFRNYSADATSFVVTYPIDSAPANRAAALAWEAAFISLAKGRLSDLARGANLTLAFSAERSVQDELARESYTDASIVAASYAAMLAYVAAALGALPPARQALQLLVLSRGALGGAGVLIVLASVAGGTGLASLLGVWSTLISLEVIPFLVLAVGVDNMFVLAHALARQDHSLPLPERAGLALGAAGPSITLAASCEVLAFALGALLTPMPAVRNFSVCAALAVLLDFVLQVTVFVALLALDTRRMEQRRLDCFPCVRVPYLDDAGHWVHDAPDSDADDDAEAAGGWGAPPPGRAAASSAAGGYYDDGDGDAYFAPQPLLGGERGGDDGGGVGGGRAGGGGRGRRRRGAGAAGGIHGALHERRVSLGSLLQRYMERVHAPLLMLPAVQAGVVAVFVTGLFLSAAAIPRLQVGLDQAVALPRDSYLQQYFKDLYATLRVGPPLYLVVRGLNLTAGALDANKVCSIAGCQKDSLLSRVSEAAMAPESSFIASPAASWIDDFYSWLNPSLPKCCRRHPEGSPFANATGGPRCPPPDQPPCAANSTVCSDCGVCYAELPGGRPPLEGVREYLPWFLEAVPSEGCAKGGAGAYGNALQMDPSDATGIAGLSHGFVAASSFRTYHTALNTQDQFIGALSAARAFASAASKELGLDIYPYSVFHVFFEQYLAPAKDAAAMVGLPCLAVVAAAWAFTGSAWASGVLLLMLASLLAQLGGAMYLAGIQVNAVSLVNLAMALGIAVEFNAHILHSFCVTPGSRPARARAALVKMGAPVTSGITLTKFVGVAVLAFARTQIFEVYYFRLYLALVILGAAHGLVLLPVVLSRIGPPSWSEGKGGGNGGGGGSGRGRWREVEVEAGQGAFRGGGGGEAAAAAGGGPAEAVAPSLPALAAAGAAAAAAALEEREHAFGGGGGSSSGGSFAGGSADELEGMEMSDTAGSASKPRAPPGGD